MSCLSFNIELNIDIMDWSVFPCYFVSPLSNLLVWTGLEGGVSFILYVDYFPKAALFSRKARGDDERMLVLFFDRVWSISSPSTLLCQV